MNAQSQPTVVSLPPVVYRELPVVTTELLAKAYECESKQIRQNFSNNSERFVEGKHFFKVEGDELKGLRDCIENFDAVVVPRTRNLLLWTERGAARHAKMLNTDRAWDVFELLEDSYFRAKEATKALPAAPDMFCIPKSKLQTPYNRLENIDAISALLRQELDDSKDDGLKIGWSWNDPYGSLNLHITFNKTVLVRAQRVN